MSTSPAADNQDDTISVDEALIALMFGFRLEGKGIDETNSHTVFRTARRKVIAHLAKRGGRYGLDADADLSTQLDYDTVDSIVSDVTRDDYMELFGLKR